MSNARKLADNLPSVGQLGNRNMIINGAMRIAQRDTSVTSVTAAGYRTCDRFLFGPTSGTYTVTQESSASTADGFTNSFKIATTATGSSSNITVQQRMEGQHLQRLCYGTSSAKQTTVSFYVKSNKTGTYTLELYNTDNTTRQISKNYTIDASNTWERKTITFPGDTSNGINNDNALSMYLFWWLAAPSTFTSGTQNTSAWANATNANRVSSSIVDISDTVGNYWEITGVQWEVGPQATPFEHEPLSVTLSKCQRYFYQPVNVTSGSTQRFPYYTASAYSSGINVYGTFMFPVTMRAGPTYSVANIGGFRMRFGADTQATGSVVHGAVGTNGITPVFQASGVTFTPGRHGWIEARGGCKVSFDAEL
tara:strand:- start:212 stop:1309 length:1098 start_codon:yes stop_codon:yes gene_type:complete